MWIVFVLQHSLKEHRKYSLPEPATAGKDLKALLADGEVRAALSMPLK